MSKRSRTPSGRYYDWPEIIRRARAADGRSVLLIPNAPRSVVKTIRLRRARELVLTDGHLEAEARNEYVDPDGLRRANVYVRFVSDILPSPEQQPE